MRPQRFKSPTSSTGEARSGKTFDPDVYGAMGYRAINFSYRQFPVYFGGLLFDQHMKPRSDTPEGLRAIQQFTSIVRYMPPDIQGWGPPQIYPFFARGQAFSVMSFPSIVGYAQSNPKQIFAFGGAETGLSRSATDHAFGIWKALGDSLLVCI